MLLEKPFCIVINDLFKRYNVLISNYFHERKYFFHENKYFSS